MVTLVENHKLDAMSTEHLVEPGRVRTNESAPATPQEFLRLPVSRKELLVVSVAVAAGLALFFGYKHAVLPQWTQIDLRGNAAAATKASRRHVRTTDVPSQTHKSSRPCIVMYTSLTARLAGSFPALSSTALHRAALPGVGSPLEFMTSLFQLCSNDLPSVGSC